MANISELRQQQIRWEDTFRKRYPTHQVLTLVDEVLKLTPERARSVEERYVPSSPTHDRLIGKARALANSRAGKDFTGIVTMVTNAAIKAAPNGWQSAEIFRLCNAVDAALWAVLAQEQLSEAEYDALAGPLAVGIPEVAKPAGLPEKEEPLPVAAPEPKAESQATAEPQPKNNDFMADAQRWADANPDLYADFQKSKMGYVGGAFSYTCEKVIAEAGATESVGRGQRTLAAFAVFASAIVGGNGATVFKGRAKAESFFAGREVVKP